MTQRPIEDHALLSDCHAAALVDRTGDVVWWCGDRFDGPSVFGRILDEDAGHFRIGPADGAEAVERRYRDGSLVLVTTFRTASGVLELTDALAMANGSRGHQLGIDSPHVLLRRVRCLEGEVDVDVSFVPRFEYGLTKPLLEIVEGGVVARGGASCLTLTAQRDLLVEGRAARVSFRMGAGETAAFAVEHCSRWEHVPAPWDPGAIAERLDDTVEAWRTWGDDHQRYEGPYADHVSHSGRVLQGLTYRPTGAMVAAPTTSLPETIGGGRNWDYRFTWARDAAMTLDALWVAACPDEAHLFLHYLTTTASSFEAGNDLQIMFGIRGERDLSERELPWMGGWRDSSPVRVGNAAWHQRQLDVYGEVLDAVHVLREQMEPFDGFQRRFLRGLADTAAEVWTERDRGIWEIRTEPRHHTSSKLMCWVALDRAIDLAGALDVENGRLDHWRHTRSDIATELLDRAWNDDLQAFTMGYDDDHLDASSLLVPIVGFLPGDDERVLSTIAAIEERLLDRRGLVLRYQADDGLDGEEGSFLLCTFWLAQAHALAGHVDEARRVFERAVDHVNDVGLLAEQVDSSTGAHLGNFPQAFSHIGLINAAWAIGEAEERDRQHGSDVASSP